MTRAAALLCALALAGCTVGPDYRRPAAAVINLTTARGDFAGLSQGPFVRTPPPGRWWELYHDPQLDGLIAEALTANTDLRVASANIARAQAGRELESAARYPATTASAGVAYSRLSPQERLLPNVDLPATFVYDLGAGLSYQVDLFGQIRRAVEQANADVAATRAAYDATRITVVAQTTLAYSAACSAGREISIARKSIDLQARSSVLTETLFRAGRGTALDVARAAALENRVRATVPPLEAARRVALYRLAVLTGRPPAEFSQTVAACVLEPRLTQPIPVGDGGALLARRPDVRRAEYLLHAATAGVGVATADLYPKVVLGTSVGSIGPTSAFLDYSTAKYSLGPLISWEFPNRRLAKARIHGAGADVDAAFAQFDGTVLEALREAETALTTYAHDLDQRRLLQLSRDQAALAARDADKLFRLGRETYLSVLEADIALVSADQALAALDTSIAADQVTVFLALGGGWETGNGVVVGGDFSEPVDPHIGEVERK